MDTDDLSVLSKNYFAVTDFAEMELDILFPLNWRINGPTVLWFIEHFFAVMSTTSTQIYKVRNTLLHISKQYAELTLGDYDFVTKKPSTVAIAIISNSLKHISREQLNPSDRLSFFSQIATVSNVDFGSQEIHSARKMLASTSNKICKIPSKYISLSSYLRSSSSIWVTGVESSNQAPKGVHRLLETCT